MTKLPPQTLWQQTNLHTQIPEPVFSERTQHIVPGRLQGTPLSLAQPIYPGAKFRTSRDVFWRHSKRRREGAHYFCSPPDPRGRSFSLQQESTVFLLSLLVIEVDSSGTWSRMHRVHTSASVGERKFAEKLTILVERGQGILTRVYNIKKVRYQHLKLWSS